MEGISNSAESIKEAWAFYAQEQSDLAKEDEAIKEAGQPSSDHEVNS